MAQFAHAVELTGGLLLLLSSIVMARTMFRLAGRAGPATGSGGAVATAS
ncbi:hypothetical protein [Micromonospora marina]